MAYTIKFKRALSTEWTEKDPVLSDGEPGIEEDSDKFKIGDGLHKWSELTYYLNQTWVEFYINQAIDDLIISGGDNAEVHVQASPSMIWYFTHALNREPGVAVYVGGTLVFVPVDVTTTDVTITFTTPTTGKVVLT